MADELGADDENDRSVRDDPRGRQGFGVAASGEPVPSGDRASLLQGPAE